MRKPDFVIGDEKNPYLLRWFIIPQNPVFNIYLHKFLRDDDDRALHDHPWISLSIILKGSYIECTPGLNGRANRKRYMAKSWIFRRAVHRHRIELIKYHQVGEDGKLRYMPEPVWTLFITGPKIREWGFWCNGWRFVHWKKFTSPTDTGKTGKGCAQ